MPPSFLAELVERRKVEAFGSLLTKYGVLYETIRGIKEAAKRRGWYNESHKKLATVLSARDGMLAVFNREL